MSSLQLSPDGSIDQIYRDRIIRTLTVYPRISPSMLHIGIGPAVPAKVWRPVMDLMVSEGILRLESTASGGRNYTVVCLNEQATPKT